MGVLLPRLTSLLDAMLLRQLCFQIHELSSPRGHVPCQILYLQLKNSLPPHRIGSSLGGCVLCHALLQSFSAITVQHTQYHLPSLFVMNGHRGDA